MRRVLLGSVVAVALAGLTGCGGAGGGNSIVGTWEHKCFQRSGHEDERYRTIEVTFNQDKSFKENFTQYSDTHCTQDPDLKQWFGTYKIGGAAKDSNGKDTTEFDLTQTKSVHGDTTSTKVSTAYSMYRFLDNGNLVFAHSSDAHSGNSKETRANYIGSKWTGFTKKN